MLTPASQIALLGFGAQSARLARALAPRGCALKAFDTALHDPARATAWRAHVESQGVDVMPDAAATLRGARLVVRDTGAPDAAALATLLQPGQVLLDFSVASDDTPAIGARFTPDGTRLQVTGPRAAALAAALTALGLATDAVSSATLRALPAPPQLPGPPHAVTRGELP